jgi:hypothetical protein
MGNRRTAGRDPDKLLRDALLISLNRRVDKANSTKRFQKVADALVDAAIKGELTALREVFDRVDGKFPKSPPSPGKKKQPEELVIRWLTDADPDPNPNPES